jgi:hypothetical protein
MRLDDDAARAPQRDAGARPPARNMQSSRPVNAGKGAGGGMGAVGGALAEALARAQAQKGR